MDEQGIDRALMFPTLASLVEERMRDDPELTHAVIHALNQWIYETWHFDYEGRIFTTPVITLPIVDRAIEELEWVVERGARVVLIRPAPVPGYRGPRSFGLAEFDPFWEKVVEHDVLVAMHSSDSGYERYANDWMGERQRDAPVPAPGLPHALGLAARRGRRVRAGLPRRPVAVPRAQGGGRSRTAAAGSSRCSRTWPTSTRRCPRTSSRTRSTSSSATSTSARSGRRTSAPWPSSSGSTTSCSDPTIPHPEGLADPASYVDELAGLPEEAVRQIMGGNLARLMNVDDAVPA